MAHIRYTCSSSSGDVVGPASSTNNAIARWDLASGKLIQDSAAILSDAGIITGLTGITSSGSLTFTGLTANRALTTGASSVLTVSSTTDTELGYVNGVTSAIQTQLDAKGTLDNIVEDTTPQLGGSLDVNGQTIVSASAGDIAITPDTTGDIILDGLKWPQADGTANYVLETDGAGQLAWVAQGAGSGDVTAAAVMTDNTLVKGDGGSKGVQDSGIVIDDSDNVSAMGTLGCGAITSTGLLTLPDAGIQWSTAAGSGIVYDSGTYDNIAFNVDSGSATWDMEVVYYETGNNYFYGNRKADTTGPYLNMVAAGTTAGAKTAAVVDGKPAGLYVRFQDGVAAKGSEPVAGGFEVIKRDAAGTNKFGGDTQMFSSAKSGSATYYNFTLNSQGQAIVKDNATHTAALPSLVIEDGAGNIDNGLWSSATDTINLSTAGVERVEIDASEASFVPPIATTDSTDSTTSTTGAIKSAGGIGIAKNVVAGGQVLSALNAIGVSGTTETISWNNSNVQTITLDNNCTFTYSNGIAGGAYTIICAQDATGSRLITWPADVLWPGGTAPTLTTTASAIDIFTFIFDGTNYFGGVC